MNQADKETTQRLIVKEVYARIEDTFYLLDEEPESVEQIYVKAYIRFEIKKWAEKPTFFVCTFELSYKEMCVILRL